jgi:hypothetical protein
LINMTRMREFSRVASVGKAFLSYVGPSSTYASVVALVKKKKEKEKKKKRKNGRKISV